MPLPSTDPLMPTEILPGLHGSEAALFQQVAYRRGLLPAMLKQQPAARLRMARRGLDEMANVIQPVGAADQRTGRLEADITLGQVRVVRGDIGRVGDDQVVPRSAQRGKPVALQEADVSQPQASTI